MIRVTVKRDEIDQRINAIRDALNDWRPFWQWYYDTKDMPQIAEAHFFSGRAAGSGHSKETKARRRAGRFISDRSSSDFYLAFTPRSRVRDSGPRMIWTGNTLRSTWQPAQFSQDRMTISTDNVELLASSGPSYRSHGGPFTDYVSEPWDLLSLDASLENRATQYFAQLAETGKAPA